MYYNGNPITANASFSVVDGITTALWVNITNNGDGTYSTDRTHAEIMAACNAGQVVCCKYGSLIYPLTSAVSVVCIFGGISSAGIYRTVSIDSKNEVTVKTQEIQGGASGGGGADDTGGTIRDSIMMADRETGIVYALYVSNGKLTMEKAEV